MKKGRLVKCKPKFNPFTKSLMMNSGGFPDFITTKHVHDELYMVMGVEVKMKGLLSKEEKEKCRWYLENKIFSRILIAKKGDKKGEIEYVDFEKRYGKKTEENSV
jgi:hypothetical protein